MRSKFMGAAGILALCLSLLTSTGTMAEGHDADKNLIGTCTIMTIAGGKVKITGEFEKVTLGECKQKLPENYSESRGARKDAAKKYFAEGHPESPDDVRQYVEQRSPNRRYLIQFDNGGSPICFSMSYKSIPCP